MEVWLSDDRLMKYEDYELAKDEIIGRLDNESFYGLYKAFLEAQVRLECEKWTDDRMLYVFKAPEILEKAWKMPWGWGKSDDFKPVLVFHRDILPISHANDGVHNAYDYLWDFVYPK